MVELRHAPPARRNHLQSGLSFRMLTFMPNKLYVYRSLLVRKLKPECFGSVEGKEFHRGKHCGQEDELQMIC
jgi:hypothetical protein